jgi:hypothetical protein
MAANGIKEVDLKKAARAAANWISSEEGQKALKEVLDIRFTI